MAVCFVYKAALRLAARGLDVQWLLDNAGELHLELEALRQAYGGNPPPRVGLLNAVGRECVQLSPATATP